MTRAQMIWTDDNTKDDCLYIAVKLSDSKWKLMFSNRVKKCQKTIATGDLDHYLNWD